MIRDEGSSKYWWILIGVFVNVETVSFPLQLQKESPVAHATTDIKTIEDCQALIAEIQGQPGFVQPKAWAVGINDLSRHGKPLAAWFPGVNYFTTDIVEGEEKIRYENAGVAAPLADQVGYQGGVATHKLNSVMIIAVIAALEPYRFDGNEHPNLKILDDMRKLVAYEEVAVTFIEDPITMPPEDMQDAYLRLHLLSHRKVQPHGINLDGIFGILPNNAWTNFGPIEPEDVTWARLVLMKEGKSLVVYGIDKFPRMTDYVIPSGVRIADADRVRLGAYLAEGTTVMQEGFCNFNAGTLGASMVEGRISAGVVVGDGSDIGGGASIMGTLSGGGKEVISIGEGCLLGANSGLGISLGDNCVVEAGLYLTAGTKVTTPEGEVVKAAELSGRDDLLFRQDSTSGTVMVLPNQGADWGGLNAELHQN